MVSKACLPISKVSLILFQHWLDDKDLFINSTIKDEWVNSRVLSDHDHLQVNMQKDNNLSMNGLLVEDWKGGQLKTMEFRGPLLHLATHNHQVLGRCLRWNLMSKTWTLKE